MTRTVLQVEAVNASSFESFKHLIDIIYKDIKFRCIEMQLDFAI